MPEPTNDSAFDESTYTHRQLIVVQPDEVVAEERKQKDKSSSGAMGIFSGIGSALLFNSYAALLKMGYEAYKAVQRARESGLPVQALTAAEAKKLKFPPGHPVIGTLYVSHPAKAKVYYTAAMFHRMVFEHKFSEAVDLLMSLGATSLEVQHIEGWSREFSASISTPLPNGPVTVDASAGSKSAKNSEILFKAEFDNPHPPELPTDMVWYEHEPTWSNVAKGRLKHGMKEFSLTVAYQEDFGINSQLKLTATNAGLELGGKFENHQATTWKISGKFSIRPSPGSDVPKEKSN